VTKATVRELAQDKSLRDVARIAKKYREVVRGRALIGPPFTS
jgi:hypothetical protein